MRIYVVTEEPYHDNSTVLLATIDEQAALRQYVALRKQEIHVAFKYPYDDEVGLWIFEDGHLEATVGAAAREPMDTGNHYRTLEAAAVTGQVTT